MKIEKFFLIALCVMGLSMLLIIFYNAFTLHKININRTIEIQDQIMDDAFRFNRSKLIGNIIIDEKENISNLVKKIHKNRKLNTLLITKKNEYFTAGTLIPPGEGNEYDLKSRNGTYYGKLRLGLNHESLIPQDSNFIILIIFMEISFIFIILFFLFLYFKKKFLWPLEKMILSMKRNKDFKLLKHESVEEILQLSKKYNQMRNDLKKSASSQAFSEIASQVAHDIRSPLSAMSIIMSDLNTLPETTRLILRSSIQRIQDIANNLSIKNKKSNPLVDHNQLSTQLLSGCIDEIISEKRLHFRSKIGTLIEAGSNKSYGLFAKIHLIEFKRVLSNLMNNAVEAFGENPGLVTIHLEKFVPPDHKSTEKIKITIEDNGKGIPKSQLYKLGQKGLSFGKENEKDSGSGLGLYHAKKTIESWGGGFKIESEVEKGTKVILTLPKEKSPKWFVSKIHIKGKTAVVVLDDDQGIHQTWSKKLQEKGFPKEHTFHLCCPDTFSSWIKEKSILFEKVLYLCDFELIGFKKTGLDLIEEFSLGKNAFLVTSHYEEEDIQKRCEKAEIKLIPKMIVAHVPINITTPQEKSVQPIIKKSHTIKKSILLDDDILTRMVWESKAKEKGVHLEIFEFSKDLYQSIDSIPKDSIFYIDSNLSDNEKGEHVALELFNRGYKNLYMATGYEPETFKNLKYLKGTIGKAPPWGERSP